MQDPVGALLELGADLGEAAGLARQPVGVGPLAHGGGAHEPLPRRDRGARQDPGARGGAHGVGLPGEDGLVDLQPVGGQELAVGGDLLPAAQPHDVVQDDVRHVDVGLAPVAPDVGGGRLEDAEAVQGALGADLGEGARGRVEHQHEAEQRVHPLPHEEHHDQGGAQDGVEDGQQVGPQDRRRRARAGLPVGVGQPLSHALAHLGGAQAPRGAVRPDGLSRVRPGLLGHPIGHGRQPTGARPGAGCAAGRRRRPRPGSPR